MHQVRPLIAAGGGFHPSQRAHFLLNLLAGLMIDILIDVYSDIATHCCLLSS
jgi:hypothetical protein